MTRPAGGETPTSDDGENTVPMTMARRIGTVALIVVGALALLAGIGMRTWWLPPATLSASVPGPSGSTPVTVIDRGVVDAAGGKDVTVSIKGSGAFVLAQGRTADVEAWVGPAAHTTITGRGDDLAATPTAGESRVPDPSGADLFVTTQRATGALTHVWPASESGDRALLLAADGTAAAPTDVTVSWDNDQSAPWAVPLIVLGAIALVGGLALLVLRRRGPAGPPPRRGRHTAAPDEPREPGADRSERRPARATGATTPAVTPSPTGTYRPDHGTERTAVERTGAPERRSHAGSPLVFRPGVAPALGSILVAGVVAAGLLTGIPTARAAESPSAPASASAPASSDAASAPAGVALQPQQVDRIMGSVASVVGKADVARSAAALPARMGGEALAERTANYRIRAKEPTYRSPATIAAGPVLAQMITTGAAWPRTVVMVTKDDASTVPQILTLTQASPRENYRVVSAVGLLPGTTFPQAGSDEPAVRPLDPARADGLTTSPRAALSSLASVLTAGRPTYARSLAKNRFVDQLVAGQAAAVKANPTARISGRHTPDAAETRVLQTADGGALVIGALDNAVTVAPKASGGRLTLRSELAVLAGVKDSRMPVDIRYGESVVLYVPAAGSREAVQVIGAAQELLSVTRR